MLQLEPSGWAVTPEELEELIDAGEEAGVRWTSLCDFVTHQKKQDMRWTLTFDDGSSSFIEYAAPLLQRRGVPATVFACTDYARGSGGWWPDYPLSRQVHPLSFDELAGIGKVGFNIGSHAHQHVSLRTLDDKELGECLTRSKDDLQAIPGSLPCLAFPFGVADARVRQAASAAGFTTMFSLGPGTSRRRALATMPPAVDITRPVYRHYGVVHSRFILAGGDQFRGYLARLKHVIRVG
jgi:peptidoglycan/xylan/chitin deacetylase (PgdA/CDA1 family)